MRSNYSVGFIRGIIVNFRHQLAIFVARVVFIIVLLPLGMISSQLVEGGGSNSTSNIGIFPTDSKPYGLTYGEWSAKWWQWTYSIPEENNPISDTTGKECARGQNGPIWFLAGSFGGTIERTCTIPVGKSIFIPIANVPCSPVEFPDVKTETDMSKCAKHFQDQITYLEVIVDGIKLTNLENYRVQSPLFNFILPENNVFGTPAGTYPAVGDGNYVILQPLSAGKHEISWKGIALQLAEGATNTFANEAIWHLTVSP